MTASVFWSDQCTTGHAQAAPTWRAGLQGRDVVVVSPQYWGDYWVSKHWIAYEFSRQLRTTFIEPPVWVGGMLKNAWAYRAHIRGLLQPMRRVDRNLYVLTPKLLPGNNIDASLSAANQRTVETLQRTGIRRPIVLNFGTNFDLLKRLNGAPTVYYCVDPPVTDAACANAEVLTCEASDLIYAVSEAQRARLAALSATSRLHVIPHGYAFQHARRIAEDASSSCPRELRSLPRPILGFVGSIHDAFVDIDRVEKLARRWPQFSIVLLGPYRNNPLGPDLSSKARHRLGQLPNVHLLGPRHFLDVPRYVKYFDVCLVLVNLKDYDESAMTSKRAHFKWLIYLSMGK